jgi:hypothetical protein
VQSSLIGKVEKAKRYAQEPQRVTFKGFTVNFDGENSEHTVSLIGAKWQCDCNFFREWGICVHTMALQRILNPMLPKAAVTTEYKGVKLE